MTAAPSPLASLKISFYSRLLFIPIGICLGILSAALIHNAAHDSVKPRWLARICGEIAGAHQLYGFLGWKIAHMIHHRYPDDPERDPHPPRDFPFWKFLLNMQKTLRTCMINNYYLRFGMNEKSRQIVAIQGILRTIGLFLRVLFWYLFLGPVLFIFLYIPSYLAMTFFFAHFNYYTHRPLSDGSFEILNLNHTIAYKLLNFFSLGSYFHKNHHLRPGIFNPQDLDFDLSEARLISYVPTDDMRSSSADDRREYRRVSTYIPAEITSASKAPLQSYISDVSIKGAFVTCETPLSINESCSIEFESIKIHARVIRAERSGIAIQFTNLSSRNLAILRQLVSKASSFISEQNRNDVVRS